MRIPILKFMNTIIIEFFRGEFPPHIPLTGGFYSFDRLDFQPPNSC